MSAPEAGTGLTRAQRREFVDAFVEQTWARPDADRPVARVQIVVLVATMAAVAAVVVGVVKHLINPATPAAAAPRPVPMVQPYSAVSGWDCGNATDHGFDANGRTAQWLTMPTGGWSKDGCHGTFEAIPMSGDAGRDSPNQYVVWWFQPGAGTNRCQVEVYVPAPDNPSDSAAAAAHFAVLAGRNGTEFAQFAIDQTRGRASWTPAGTYPVNQGGLAVKLVNRGAPATPRARLSVTQVRVTCTG
jgi:hypothetical protein